MLLSTEYLVLILIQYYNVVILRSTLLCVSNRWRFIMRQSPSLPSCLGESRTRGFNHRETLTLLSGLQKADRRQRTFAALAHDTACLQELAALLAQRNTSTGKDSIESLLEETQVYAVCMQELSVQISIQSPQLSSIASSLYKGFTLLFKRALEHEKSRLAKEREVHASTRESLTHALKEVRMLRDAASQNERQLSSAQAEAEEKARALTHTQELYHQARSQAKRLRKLLDGYLSASQGSQSAQASQAAHGSKEPYVDDPALRLLTESVARVDETVAEAETLNDEIGATVDNLHLMARTLAMHAERHAVVEEGTQTVVTGEMDNSPFALKRRIHSFSSSRKKGQTVMYRIARQAANGECCASPRPAPRSSLACSAVPCARAFSHRLSELVS